MFCTAWRAGSGPGCSADIHEERIWRGLAGKSLPCTQQICQLSLAKTELAGHVQPWSCVAVHAAGLRHLCPTLPGVIQAARLLQVTHVELP